MTTPRPSTSSSTSTSPNVPPKVGGYSLGERVGAGSYASVYRAVSLAPTANGIRETVAIKCIEKNRLRTSTGADNLKLRHKHIVQMLDFQWDTTCIYLIMEYCSGGDLSAFIRTHRQLSERVARKFFRQLASAMYYMHERNIAHMDLKPHNLVLTNTYRPSLKVADFGFAQHLRNSDDDDKGEGWTSKKFRGSLLYMAPEIYKRENYDARVDLWSVGVILYECLFGVAPFACDNEETLIAKIVSPTPITLRERVPPLTADCVSLLSGLLQRDPRDRLTFDAFFQHTFVDVFSVPSAQSLTIAHDLRRRAETCNDAAQAVRIYTKALDHYLAALQYVVDDDNERERLRRTISEVLAAAETCKRRARPPPSAARMLPSESGLSARGSGDDVVDRVKQMWQDVPQVSAALTIATRADILCVAEQWSSAMDKYTMAVESMLIVLAREQQQSSTDGGRGPRALLLRTLVDAWLTRAEQIRTYVDLEELHLSEVPAREQDVLQIEEETAKIMPDAITNTTHQNCSIM